MDPTFSNPSFTSFLGSLSLGTIYSRCLIAVLAIQAIAITIFLVNRARCILRHLDEEAKERRAQEAIYADMQDPEQTETETVEPAEETDQEVCPMPPSH